MKSHYSKWKRSWSPLFLFIALLAWGCDNDEPEDEFCANLNFTAGILANSNKLSVIPQGGIPPYSFEWSNGSDAQSILVPGDGTYSVTVYDINACIAVTSIVLENVDYCVDSTLLLDIEANGNALKATPTGGAAPYSFLWNTGSTSQIILVTNQTSFNVQVTDALGCTASSSIEINPCDGQTVVSVSGVSYALIAIGNQCWTVKNMRHNISGVYYHNGFSSGGWSSRTTPTSCAVDNNSLNDAAYGRLYNWWAVNTQGMCPNGWRVPTNADYFALSEAYGGSALAGGALKATTGWTGANSGATNSSSFTALPAGLRTSFGEFSGLGTRAAFWTSSNVTFDWLATSYDLNTNNTSFNSGLTSYKEGRCVRCIKN
jgi:uncharacterized protein (TIGR02145 family)